MKLSKEKMNNKIKVINKKWAAITYNTGSPRIEPNPFEMAKEYCILDANGKVPVPSFSYDVYKFEDNYPDLVCWFEALGFQNSSKIHYRSNPTRFRELVEVLDFSKPYDQSIVDKIQAEFTGVVVKQELNADDLINAELSE